MASRSKRVLIAAETVAILAKGTYLAPGGQAVDISADLNHCVNETRLYRPGQVARCADEPPPPRGPTRFRVEAVTTFAAARELVARHGPGHVTALNFASARNPGGGFLNGSQAQEESLARASALYASLRRMPDYYEANREERSALYTDHMIYSPQVPVFRDDDDTLLDEPWRVSILTAPAANAGAVRRNEPTAAAQIPLVMQRRIRGVLGLAAHHGQRAVVLGAWGCGVFANDSDEVASLFAAELLGEGRFSTAFDEVVFAILDRKGDNFRAFAAALGG